VGDTVQVYILSIDNDRRRIALSLKRTQREPWSTVSERYHLGQIVEGTITQIASFGAFARIEDGIEGLIHISELDEGHVQHPRDVVNEGQTIPVRIIRIDPSRKRMGLSLRIQAEASANGTNEQSTLPEPAVNPTHLDTEANSLDGDAPDSEAPGPAGDAPDSEATPLAEHTSDPDNPEALPERKKSEV
jgi:ribosomal protein S1